MTDLFLMKAAGNVLVPCDEPARATIATWPAGQGIRAKVTRARNVKFHRKFFALLQLGFDTWEPAAMEYEGAPAVKNFERFRKDVIVLAGYYTRTVNLKGEIRLEAESISFSNMDEDRFDQVYNRVADVLLQKVLTRYTREDLDRVVDQLLAFL